MERPAWLVINQLIVTEPPQLFRLLTAENGQKAAELNVLLPLAPRAQLF